MAAKITGAAFFLQSEGPLPIHWTPRVEPPKKPSGDHSYLTGTTGTRDTTGTRGITVTIGTLHATYKLMLTMHLS